MRLIITIIFANIFWINHAQVVNPKIWYIGYQNPDKKDTSSPDNAPHVLQQGTTILNFIQNPKSITRFGYSLSLLACNVQLYDKNNSLILYSNGSKIFNGNHRLIEGGDSLSYGSDWQTSLFAGNYYGHYIIGAYQNPMIALPSIKNENQYYFISIFISSDFNNNPKLVYCLVDMSLNGGKGKIIEKEVVLKSGELGEAITACKHGNGRDWWIITREYGKKNFIVMLLDSSGIKIHSEPQVSGWDLADWNAERGNFTNQFSWDGSMFASFTHLGVELFDFNRCNGSLTNRRVITIPTIDTMIYAGAGGFSPNSKLLYLGNRYKYYQADIFNGSKLRKIATFDGFRDTPIGQTGGIQTDLGVIQIAHDGKIYMSTTETTRYLHVIENPNDTGILCNFKQHAIKLLTFAGGLPKYPNYELGAVAGKCGESGIADNEIEKIDVYPNPANSHISLSGISVVKPIRYRIYNILGQELKQGETAKDIDLSSLSNGHYFITLTDDRFRQMTKRIEVRR
jgi:hypothetical protein